MALETYRKKRDFTRTNEPPGKVAPRSESRFVVQEHHASRLHFDLRLEMDGVLKSWAVPKGPSLDPRDRRLAVMTEDHPVEYLTFEGHIPEGSYGAGDMIIWDRGNYHVEPESPPDWEQAGELKFVLKGEKLKGSFVLVKLRGEENQWLLIKHRDEHAADGWQLQTLLEPKSSRPATGGRETRGRAKEARTPAQKTDVKAEAKSKTAKSDSLKRRDAEPPEKLFKHKDLQGDAVALVDGCEVKLTSLERLYWPEAGYTKADLLRYYWKVAPTLLTHLKDRPLINKRHPEGANGPSFFQHHVEDPPPWMETFSTRAGNRVVRYALCNNLATLLYLANQGTLAQNPWHSRRDTIDQPDWIVFDLDPADVPYSGVLEAALKIQELLRQVELDCFPKTSGSRGLHLYLPLAAGHTYEQAGDFAELLAALCAREYPDLITVERALKDRPPRTIYLDAMQNARGKSVASVYSPRARPGATVSTPLTWAEVKKGVEPGDFTLGNLPARLQRRGDLFEPVLQGGCSLQRALAKLSGEGLARLAKRAPRRRIPGGTKRPSQVS